MTSRDVVRRRCSSNCAECASGCGCAEEVLVQIGRFAFGLFQELGEIGGGIVRPAVGNILACLFGRDTTGLDRMGVIGRHGS